MVTLGFAEVKSMEVMEPSMDVTDEAIVEELVDVDMGLCPIGTAAGAAYSANTREATLRLSPVSIIALETNLFIFILL